MIMDPNWVAAFSALGGTLIGVLVGVLGAAFERGRSDGVILTKLDSLEREVKILTDELARRITVLENRYQYDGLYLQPRTRRSEA